MSRDPIGYRDGLNVYNYVHCNPINHIDPLGLENDDDEVIIIEVTPEPGKIDMIGSAKALKKELQKQHPKAQIYIFQAASTKEGSAPPPEDKDVIRTDDPGTVLSSREGLQEMDALKGKIKDTAKITQRQWLGHAKDLAEAVKYDDNDPKDAQAMADVMATDMAQNGVVAVNECWSERDYPNLKAELEKKNIQTRFTPERLYFDSKTPPTPESKVPQNVKDALRPPPQQGPAQQPFSIQDAAGARSGGFDRNRRTSVPQSSGTSGVLPGQGNGSSGTRAPAVREEE